MRQIKRRSIRKHGRSASARADGHGHGVHRGGQLSRGSGAKVIGSQTAKSGATSNSTTGSAIAARQLLLGSKQLRQRVAGLRSVRGDSSLAVQRDEAEEAAAAGKVAAGREAAHAAVTRGRESIFLDDRVIIALVLLPLIIAAVLISGRDISDRDRSVSGIVRAAADANGQPPRQPSRSAAAVADTPAKPNLKDLPAITVVANVDQRTAAAGPEAGGNVALVDAGPATAANSVAGFGVSQPMPQVVAAASLDELDVPANRCTLLPAAEAGQVELAVFKQAAAASSEPEGGTTGSSHEIDFGRALAQAAESQRREFVVYTDSYRRLPFPMGDVAPLFGVCTDVVIRAYRALGIDLQALVHAARVGSGDANIDHRRTAVLRRFFARFGQTLPITDVGDDYLPGDIVTYDRPQNSGSRSHIAIVSSRIAPSGRPMIVHNRGWGPQIEDGLFVDRITGHYRYAGQPVSNGKPSTKPAMAVFSLRQKTSAKAQRVVLKPVSQRRVRSRVSAENKAKRKGAKSR